MTGEFEVVSHTRLKHVTAFLVRLRSRVTHIHRELELGYVLDGEISLRTGNQLVRLARGDLFLVNRMEPHEFISEGDGALLLAIQLSSRLMDGFLAPGVHHRYEGSACLRMEMNEKRYRLLCGQCIALAHHFLAREKDYEFRCFSLCGNIVCLLHGCLSWQTLEHDAYHAIKQRANRIMAITDYIDRNFQRKLLLGEIAEMENLSVVYLSHFFKDTLGMTFQEYLNRKRLDYACRLLFTTDRKILDISLSSGFSDVRYFNEGFLSRYGCTPKEFRKENARQSAQLRCIDEDTQQFFSDREALELLHPIYRLCKTEDCCLPLSFFQ